MNSHKIQNIFSGRFDNLPKPKSKVVRIFLSSTFSDFHTERDYLIEKIYPKLKTYCKSTYGLDFTVLDMRWGISHEVTNSHTTTSICLNEISACQKYSAGPNFIALLSHRYGSRGLPERILSTEFDLLRSEVKNNSDTINMKFSYNEDPDAAIEVDNLLEYCYELDENELPCRYRLIRLEKCFPNYNPKKPIFETVWNMIEKKLGNNMRTVAKLCYEKGVFSLNQYERFFVSVTEKEVFKGILTAKNITNNVLFFNRNIVDIKEKIKENASLAGKFIELNKKKEPDEEVMDLLDNLKYKKIPSVLPSSNIFNFDVNWSTTSGISRETHEEYVVKFGELFYEQTKLLIDRNQQDKTSKEGSNREEQSLLQEILDHAYFCNETAEKFRGRADILNQVKSYILSDNIKPLVIYGESGCGKTAIVAKITSEILNFVPDPSNYTLIMRFLGTTPMSSNIINTFNSIIIQLSKLFLLPRPDKKITAKEKLAFYLLDQLCLLKETHPNKKVIILLDSVDQLSTDDYTLNWVWEQLPSNTKLIFSTIPSHGDLLNTFKLKAKLGEENLIQITSLDQSLAKMILSDFLKKSNRTLSEDQWQVIESRMLTQATLYPLYITLLFDIVSKWSSAVVPDTPFIKCLNIDKCIEYLFRYLEGVHGKLLFSRAIIYMSSFKNGISESEIEDILSLDDEVLYDIFEFHAPPVRKLPVALWSRIKYDLKGYMVEKEIQDTRVIYWYHRRFIEVANSFYISKLNSADRESVFSNVVDFYNETWKNKPKPYKFNEFVAKKKKLASTETAEVRDTSIQPTMFVDADGKVRYNQRKIFEMPGFVTSLTANLASVLACDYIYFDYNFLAGLLKLVPFTEIMDGLSKLGQGSSYNLNEEAKNCIKEIKLLNLVLLQCGLSIKDYPDSLGEQMLARTIDLKTQSSHLNKLIQQYDQIKSQTNSLVLAYQLLSPPGLDVIFTFDKHSDTLTHACIGGDNDSFLFTLSNKIHLLSMSEVSELGEIPLTDDVDSDFSHFIVYFDSINQSTNTPLKNLLGYFVVATETECTVYSFDSTVAFKKTFTKISNIHWIGSHCLAVFEHDKSYFDIYDIKLGQVFLHQELSGRVKDSICSSHKLFINLPDEITDIQLVVSLENGEVEFFKISEQNASQIELKSVMKIASSGSEVVSLSFIKENITSIRALGARISYQNSSILYIGQEDGKSVSKLIKPIWGDKYKNVTFKFLNMISQMELHLGSNKNLYLLWLNDEFENLQFAQIEGNFENGELLNEKHLIGIHKGIIDFYLLYRDKNEGLKEFKFVKLAQMNAHYDDIVLLFQKSPMFLTASRDSTVKVFMFSKINDIDKTQIKMDTSSSSISALHYVNENMTAAQLDDTKCVDIWDLRNGTIANSLKTADILEHVFFKDSKAVAISGGKSPKLIVQGFAIREKITKYSECGKEEFRVDLDRSDFYKAFQSHSSSSVVVLTESTNEPKVTIYNLVYEQLKEKKLMKPIAIKFDQLVKKTGTWILQNSCLSWSGMFVFIFYEYDLYVVDTQNGQVLLKHTFIDNQIDLNYFLSPTNLNSSDLYHLTPFQDPVDEFESLIALDNLNKLLVIRFNQSSKKIIRSVVNQEAKNEPASIHSFVINGNMIVAYNKQDSQLLVCSVNNLIKRNRLIDLDFQLKLNAANFFGIYGLSMNNKYVYFVENKKVLRVFNVETKKEITGTGLPLYSQPRQILCNNDFISIAMQDDRVISFLISEPERPDSLARIKNLPSRSSEDKELEAKMKFIMDKVSTMMDDSSEDGEDDDAYGALFLKDATVDKKNEQDLRKLRKKIKSGNISNMGVFNPTADDLTLNNWMKKFLNDTSPVLTGSLDISLEPSADLSLDFYQRESTTIGSFRQELIDNLVSLDQDQFKTVNTGKSVKIINNMNQSSSRACLLQ